jgi:DHA1 family bicyclomycin/chloramphenicol resistance-like MFS transporter
LLLALALFLLASVWAASSPDMGMLLAARTVQGLAASMTLVVAMSTVRDRADGVQATQLFALLMTIQGLAPVLAPSLGGVVDAAFGWRAVFLVLADLGAVALVNLAASLTPTSPGQPSSTSSSTTSIPTPSGSSSALPASPSCSVPSPPDAPRDVWVPTASR